MGEFGLQNILDIPNGPLPSTGEKFTLQDNVEVFLKVLVYDASGEFLIERTFGKTGVDENDLQFSYFIPYDGLSLEQDLLSSGLQINLQQILKEMELPQGNYYLVTNLIHYIDVASSVAAISTDRTEIQFNGVPGQSDASNTYFGENVLPQHLGYHKLDIGFGRFRRMLNWTVDSLDLITKLDAPLPNDVFGGGTYPLYMDITDPTKMYIEWEVEGDSITYPFLAPNFDIKVRSGTPAATEFKTSNDITGTVKETKDKLINKYLSSSYGEIELNIDYKDPSQFIHFSSYEERLLNFKYKLQLIEKYDLEVSASNTITGDVASSDAVVLDKNTSIRKRDEVISTFDTFENYMYFESSSHVSGTLGDFWSNTWPKSTTVKPHRIFATTSSEANEWLTGAIQSASFYDRNNPNMLSKALPEYVIDDPLNSTIITLSDMIGQHYDVVWTYVKGITDINVRDESLSTGIAKNLLWHVGTSMGMKLPNGNAAEDLWKYALGTDESGSLASSGTGFESGSLPQLSSEDVTKNIWSRLINNMPYFLRTKGTTRGLKAVLACYGVPDTIIDVKEYGGPKGLNDTERQTLTEQRTVYNPRIAQGETFKLKATKATITEQAPRAFQFRFKTTNREDMVLLEKNGVPWFVNIHHSGSITQTVQNKRASANIPQIALGERVEKGVYGRLTFLITGSLNYGGGKVVPAESQILSASTPYLPLYNGDWWNVTLQTEVSSSNNSSTDNTTQNQKWILDCRSAKDHSNGRITHSGSATLENHSGSYSASFNNAWRQFGAGTYWNFGGFSAGSNATRYNDTGVRGASGTVKQFSGSFQEIRLWTTPNKLQDRVLDIHTLSPRTIVGNNFSSSYDHLVARFPLGTQFKKSNLSGSVVTSTHPQSTLSWTTAANVLTASAFSNDTTGSDGTHFDVSTETYYTTIPSYPSNGPSSVKVRLEDNALIGNLSHNKRAEISEYDRHPKDTNTIGVHLSLQHQINRDIAYQFGDMRVDDFIGDPEHQYLPNYPDLEQLRNFYFKKLSNKPNIGDFARLVSYYDVSMFEMIKRMIPARGNSYVGLLVEPTILERNKVQRLPDMTQSAAHYRTKLDVRTETFPLSMSGAFVSEFSASLLTAGGLNWWKLNSQPENSSSFGDLPDRAGLGEVGGFTASYDGTRYQWTQHYRNKNADGTFTTGSYLHTSDPMNTVVTGSRISQIYERRLFQYSSSFSASWDTDRGFMAGGYGYGLSEPLALNYNRFKFSVINGQHKGQRGKAHIYPNIGAVPREKAERQDTNFTGYYNARYGGSKLIGNNYNQDSPSTFDGSPVIELFDANPNQLIVTSPSVFGGSLSVPGITKNPGKGSKFLDKFGNPVSPLNPKSPAVINQQVASNLSETVQTSMGGGKSYA